MLFVERVESILSSEKPAPRAPKEDEAADFFNQLSEEIAEYQQRIKEEVEEKGYIVPLLFLARWRSSASSLTSIPTRVEATPGGGTTPPCFPPPHGIDRRSSIRRATAAPLPPRCSIGGVCVCAAAREEEVRLPFRSGRRSPRIEKITRNFS